MYNIKHKHVNMYELLRCLTDAADLSHLRLASHRKETAYMAYHIAEHMGLSLEQKKNAIFAGLLHDIGADSVSERIELISDEPDSVHEHAQRGADIVKDSVYLDFMSDIIRYHHVKWENGKGAQFKGREVPLLSSILYLADRTVVMIDKDKPVLGQIKTIKEKVSEKRGISFRPDAVDAFIKLADKEYIWLDISYKRLDDEIRKIIRFDTLDLELDEVVQLTKVFANIIDIINPFTANHSLGVAHTAFELAKLAGFSVSQSKMMLIAGYLHDLGKLAVSNKIINKEGKLDKEEFESIKSHTYYTYRVLETIEGWETINEWASFHHEKLSGKGYPFHLTAEDLSLGSRIMAVADIFTALTEDRPYRKGMDKERVLRVLGDMTKTGSVCGLVVSILANNYDMIDGRRTKAQQSNQHNDIITA